MFKLVEPLIDEKMRGLCVRPYENHKKGCPNFGKKDGCPPRAPMLYEAIDLSQPVYVIYHKYAFGAHVARMKSIHPEWSKRQLECCLYWQGTARKGLKAAIADFKFLHFGKFFYINSCPEAMGLNVTATMESIGVNLEWPPVNFTHHVAIAGTTLCD